MSVEKNPAFFIFLILAARVPLAIGLLESGSPKIAIAILMLSEFLLVRTSFVPLSSPRPVSR